MIEMPAQTKEEAAAVEVYYFEDCYDEQTPYGEQDKIKVRCTPDHRFLVMGNPEVYLVSTKAEPRWVEAKDLEVGMTLVDIFSDDFLREQLAFRGGTALHKLYLSPQVRYSEDIDLVQINPGPIKPILFRLGEVLSWMPDKVIKPKRHNNTMLFRMESEIPPVQPIRLKVEIKKKLIN